MGKNDIYKKAAKRVKAKKGFLYHLVAYIGIIAMLYVIMQAENDGDFIPVIIVGLSWGIGLAGHYLSVFGTEHLEFLGFNPNWEEEELENEIERLTYKRELKERIKNEKGLLNDLDDLDTLELKEIEKIRRDRNID